MGTAAGRPYRTARPDFDAVISIRRAEAGPRRLNAATDWGDKSP